VEQQIKLLLAKRSDNKARPCTVGPKKEKPPTSAEELKRLAEAKAKIEQEEQELVQKLAEELAAKKEASALKKKQAAEKALKAKQAAEKAIKAKQDGEKAVKPPTEPLPRTSAPTEPLPRISVSSQPLPRVGEPANENPIDRRVRILENRVTNFVQDSNQRRPGRTRSRPTARRRSSS
jgi:hypothetical protein